MRARAHTRIICVHARRILHEVGRLVRNQSHGECSASTESELAALRTDPSSRAEWHGIYIHPWWDTVLRGVAPTGSLTLPSGPFFFFLRPTRGGGGASYFFSFFSLSWRHDVPYATYAFAPG